MPLGDIVSEIYMGLKENTLGQEKYLARDCTPMTAYHWEFGLEFTILALIGTLGVLATLHKRLAVNFANDLFSFQLTKIFNNHLTSKPPILRSSTAAPWETQAFIFTWLSPLAPAKSLFSL